MIDTALLKAMAAAGVTTDQIAVIAEEYDRLTADKREAKRANNRERQQRFRDRNALQRVTTRDTPPDKESPQTPKEITPPIRPLRGLITPRDELEKVLDEEHAAAVIEHRQRIRKPLTGHAAKLMAGKLSRCPDANAAADVMIANGWQGFEPEWLESRTQRATAPPGNSMTAALDALVNGKSNAPFTGQTIDASVNRTDRGSAENLVQLHAIPARR